MRGHKSDSVVSGDLCKFFKKSCKIDAFFCKIIAVRVYILTKQSDFLISIFHKLFTFFNNRLWLSAPLSASYIWHNAICAKVVATIHNINPSIWHGCPCIFNVFRYLRFFVHWHRYCFFMFVLQINDCIFKLF